MATKYIEAASAFPGATGDIGGNVRALFVDTATEFAQFYDQTNSAWRVLVTQAQTQTLTNKTLTSPTITTPTISGPVVTGQSVAVTASPLVVTAAAHAGKTIILNKVGGIATTLPAATGTGNLYRFVVDSALSAASHTIAVANATDYFRGVSIVFSDNAAAAVIGFATADTGTVASESDTITLNGSTQSGYPGTVVEIQDIDTAVFAVRITGKATGTEATPFSVAV